MQIEQANETVENKQQEILLLMLEKQHGVEHILALEDEKNITESQLLNCTRHYGIQLESMNQFITQFSVYQ